MKWVVALLVVASAGMAVAEPTRDAVMAGAERCYGIADNRAWLDCFYGSAQPMREALGLPPAPASQIRLVPPPGAAYSAAPRPMAVAAAAPPPPRKESGGFFSDLLGTTKPVVSNMPMTAYTFARNRTFTVTLANGDVYQQTEGDTAFAAWKKPPPAYLVTIMASGDKFTLKVKGEPGVSFKVVKR